MIELRLLKKMSEPAIAAFLAEKGRGDKLVHIHSDHGIWRPNAKGYTDNYDEAWVLTLAEAYEQTKTCGPEKMVTYPEAKVVPVMLLYHYQIKGKNADGNWCWPPLHSGMIEAATGADAREELQKRYSVELPMTGLRGEKGKQQQFLLCLDDMTNKPYLLDRFVDRACKHCGVMFTLNSKYLVNEGGARDFCSSECSDTFKKGEGITWDVDFDFNGIHEAVIYKITCKADGKCYIGKTTQAFTLRWYQHFYQGFGTKFHEAIKKHGLAGWTFEVIEVIDIPKGVYGRDKHTFILDRESHWIRHYDSVNNGYNSVISKVAIEHRPDCEEFQAKEYPGQCGDCQTDGHYLCVGCKHIAPFDGMELYDNRMKYYPEETKGER